MDSAAVNAATGPGALARIFQLFRAPPDPYRHPPEDLRTLQLAAVQERFAQQRPAIRLLERRAADLGINEIRTLDALVPLLFAHQTYKSYPERFLATGSWSGMTRWLQTLAPRPIAGLDYEGIVDVDEWMSRLRTAGHYVFSSSGTSGKCSFVSQTEGDLVNVVAATIRMLCASEPGIRRGLGSHRVFVLGPARGAHRNVETAARAAQLLGGEVHFMLTEPATAAHTLAMGEMRRALLSGDALPDHIAAFQRSAEQRQARISARLDAFLDLMLELRDAPALIMGGWVMHWHLCEHARRRGVPPGSFHPDCRMSAGGGLKGTSLPADYRERILEFYGIRPENCIVAYGMSEMIGMNPWSPTAHGYALCPWIVPLILDKSGETLLNPPDGTGIAAGRFAFFDLLAEGYWGGLITGDRVTVNFGPHATADGYRVPLVTDVTRYADLEEGEDKLSCAGTMEAYLRGMIAN